MPGSREADLPAARPDRFATRRPPLFGPSPDSVEQGLRAAFSRFADRWLFHVRPAERSPIVLVQRRIFVLPTRAGFALAAVLLPMLLASINYNLSLGYALTFLVAGMGVASMVHAFRNLLHLEIRPGRADPVFCGTAAEFHLLVGNPRNSRRPALRLKAHGTSIAFDVAAGDAADVALPCPTARRGWQGLGRVVIETTWPLGLIRAWSVFVPDARCLVYPVPEPAPPPLPEGTGSTPGRHPQRSGDNDFAGLRAHRPADSPRHVAWKIVARGGPLLTKQFAGADTGELDLEWDALPLYMSEESRLSRLTAWVLAAQAQGRPFSFSLPGHPLPLGSGAWHCQACLERLALHGIADERR